MNWDAIGAVGELVGAIAVVGTLAYLALQIKQQNAANRASVHNDLLEGFSDVEALLAQNVELTVLFNTGLWEPEALSDDQASQFSWLFRLFMNQYIKAYRLYQEGVVTESEWENYARTGAFFFNSPGGALFLEGHRGVFEDVMDIFRAIPTTESTMDLSLCRTKKIEK